MNAIVRPQRLQAAGTLKDRLKTLIKTQGSITVARYMAACLYDPQDGYYITRGRLGRDGDFITAPEVSQMFGEMLGLWCVQMWTDMGKPDPVHIIEMGPGRGVLMADALRAAKVCPEFLAAAKITLVENCEPLITAQRAALADHAVAWVPRLGDVPPGPSLILANEYLDCLPIRQFVRRDTGWHERLVGLKGEDLVFGIAPRPITSTAVIPERLREAPTGSLVEVRPQAQAVVSTIAQRLRDHSGAAVLIDYGPTQSEVGDTLQAVRAHKKVHALHEPGDCDLSARVDFEELAKLVRDEKLTVHGPVGQGPFLKTLGIDIRAAHLIRANRERGGEIVRERDKLTAPEAMGQLFKVLGVTSANLPTPTGFSA